MSTYYVTGTGEQAKSGTIKARPLPSPSVPTVVYSPQNTASLGDQSANAERVCLDSNNGEDELPPPLEFDVCQKRRLEAPVKPLRAPMPPLEFLDECFEIDATCGSGLRWKARPISHFKTKSRWHSMNTKFAGKPAGSCVNGYWNVKMKRRWSSDEKGAFCVHRVIWTMHHRMDPGQFVIDHRDGNPSNNRIENLRVATYAQNAANRALPRREMKGVKQTASGRWQAGIAMHLGTFETKDAAISAYRTAALALHKDFAEHLSREDALTPRRIKAIAKQNPLVEQAPETGCSTLPSTGGYKLSDATLHIDNDGIGTGRNISIRLNFSLPRQDK